MPAFAAVTWGLKYTDTAGPISADYIMTAPPSPTALERSEVACCVPELSRLFFFLTLRKANVMAHIMTAHSCPQRGYGLFWLKSSAEISGLGVRPAIPWLPNPSACLS
jgi:hypothetical protein